MATTEIRKVPITVLSRCQRFDLKRVGIEQLCVHLKNISTKENGKISDTYNEQKLKEYMQWDSIQIEVNLKLGSDAFECYTCDFTHDYIDINADYRN